MIAGGCSLKDQTGIKKKFTMSNAVCTEILEPVSLVSSMREDSEQGDLIRRMARGENLALRQFVDRWKRPLLSFFFRSVGTTEDAEELTFSTIERIFRYAHRYREEGSAESWIFRIARSRLISFYRWKRLRPFFSGMGERIAEPTPDGEGDGLQTPAEPSFVNELETGEIVAHMLAALPEGQRTPLLLFVQQGLSHAEIGGVLGLSETAVKVRIHRARQAMRELHEKGEWNNEKNK